MLASCSRWPIASAKRKISVGLSKYGAEHLPSVFPGFQRMCREMASSAQERQKGTPSQSSGARSPSFGLRSKPWSFTPDHTQQAVNRKSTTDGFNFELGRLVQFGRVVDVINTCRRMKDQGISPNLITYNLVLEACAQAGLGMEAWAVYEDMRLMNIKPVRLTFLHLLNAHRFSDSSQMWQILDEMLNHNIVADSKIYGAIISRYISAGNLEMALQFTFDMNSRGISPSIETAGGLIILAAETGFAKLAVDLAKAFEEGGVRRLDQEVWVHCLLASTNSLYADGVQFCWTYLVKDLNVLPDEGVCLDVLHTAARHGLPDLGTDALRVLKLMGASWQEHHLAPMVEAFCRAGNLKDAFMMLDIMRTSGIEPLPGTAEPIFRSISCNLDDVDSAFTTLDEIQREGKTVDVDALNVVVRAAIALGDLQRAVGTYKTYGEFNAKPTIDTFNTLLDGCVAAGHRELGDRLVAEMKGSHIKPDTRTYENIILLCLTQDTYEDAFFYLEEMKAAGHKPPLNVYDTLIHKCITAGDTRYNIAIEELKECGYPVSRRWHQYTDRTGGI